VEIIEKSKIVVLCSGGGGNLRYLIGMQRVFKIETVIVDRLCGAIDVAKNFKIPVVKLDFKSKIIDYEFDRAIGDNIKLIVLAGFMPILKKSITDKYKGCIINTHPSLLPKYGGKGMYGVKVQEKLLENKDLFAGCTVHYVDENIDTGMIILQDKFEIENREIKPWALGGLVFDKEGPLLVKAIELILKERET
jgi:phosphoribosylglycinamide formyltransferase-1